MFSYWHVTLRLTIFEIFAVKWPTFRPKIVDLGFLWGHRPKRGDFLSETDMYHHAKFHADRCQCHRRRDTCVTGERNKKTANLLLAILTCTQDSRSQQHTISWLLSSVGISQHWHLTFKSYYSVKLSSFTSSFQALRLSLRCFDATFIICRIAATAAFLTETHSQQYHFTEVV